MASYEKARNFFKGKSGRNAFKSVDVISTRKFFRQTPLFALNFYFTYFCFKIRLIIIVIDKLHSDSRYICVHCDFYEHKSPAFVFQLVMI